MRCLRFVRWAAMILALALAPAIDARVRADTVTDWNAIMQMTVTGPNSNPNFQTRWGAIVQLAVFEAVNAISGDYEPYLGIIDAPEGASVDAAVIAAAYDTLVALRPEQAAALDLDLVRDAALAAIPDSDSKDDGIAVGQQAAAALLALRENDGWNAVVPYTPGTNPGDFQPAGNAFAPQWGLITPFALVDGSQFRLPPPPGLHTKRYADDYNEVRLLGSIDSPFRPQDRTDVARFYGAASPVVVWNSAARQVSAAQGKTLTQNARIFAQLGMAMADASIAGWDTKYYYNLWRPETAIRKGDTDGNGRTVADPNWTPLLTTPLHPSYASGHATVSGAAHAVLRRAFGKDGHAVTLSISSVPDVVLNYATWKEIVDDIDDARIYGGIHFRFDQEFGAKQGHAVGVYVLENYLRSAEELDE